MSDFFRRFSPLAVLLVLLLGCTATPDDEQSAASVASAAPIVAAPAVQPALTTLADYSNSGWPPPLKGADKNGTATVTSPLFLKIPAGVVEAAKKPNAAPFVMAATAPTVDLAYHSNLPNPALNGTGWSAWGDICVATDGRVYCGTGDHGDDAGGKSFVFIYQYDPATKTLKQIVDINRIVERKQGESTFSKVHSRIEEGRDGMIYFSGTLNDGNQANQPQFKWSDAIPGAQLYQFDPKTGKAALFASLPAKHSTATCVMDRERNIWWCNLEAGPNGLWALDMATRKEYYRAPAGSMKFNRNFALARDGSIFFNGEGGIWKFDPKTKSIAKTNSAFPDKNDGMRCSTVETRDGWIYGVSMSPGRLFRYSPSRDKLEMLGPDFLDGEYSTVAVLSPDEKYVYYCPGAHGSAVGIGTPIMQYDIQKKQRKVLAFLREAFETSCDYVPGGTYGIKLSPDGGTLYVNLNGHAADAIRPKGMGAGGFGLTALAAIQIPASER